MKHIVCNSPLHLRAKKKKNEGKREEQKKKTDHWAIGYDHPFYVTVGRQGGADLPPKQKMTTLNRCPCIIQR